MKELYFRELKLSFNSINFFKKDIFTRHDTVMNFYQKNIILILEKGIIANTLTELVKELSTMLNIKESIVNDFIKKLDKMESIIKKNNYYILSSQFKYNFNEENKDIMIANTELGQDTIPYIYIPSINTLLTQKILDENELKQTEFSNTKTSEELIDNLYYEIDKINEKNIPTELAKYSLRNVLCDKVIINKKDFQDLQKSNIILPIKITYEYNKEKGCGILIDANLNLPEDNEINKYIDKKTFKSKLSMLYKEDSKKPDYIIYEEAIIEEKNKEIELRKIIKETNEIKNKHQKTKETINLIKEAIENKNKELKTLKEEIKTLTKDNKEYQKIVKEIAKKEEELKIAINSSNIKELNKTSTELVGEYNEKTKEYNEKLLDYKESHKKIYVDSFEKKLYNFEQNNNKLYGTHLYVYEENKKLKEILLKMSKKINNDSNMVDEWFNLYQVFTCYIKFMLSIMLNREPNTINSIRSEISEGTNKDPKNTANRAELGTKHNFRGDDCDTLILLETCTDHVRHKYFDSIQNYSNYQKSNPNAVKRQIEAYNKFLKLSKEGKKELLYKIIYMYERVTIDNNNLKKLNSMIKEEYDKTKK